MATDIRLNLPYLLSSYFRAEFQCAFTLLDWRLTSLLVLQALPVPT
jgi:hypothetical protein